MRQSPKQSSFQAYSVLTIGHLREIMQSDERSANLMSTPLGMVNPKEHWRNHIPRH
ncbi:hypothetical protein [Paenibacillus crassostreae]|uniref:hypothetical protein n=1 Tax=Paenibacillus crassostreae TaxID=1763538 RepID=UPI000B2A11C0|nr:hypothetical protein [Paenibacillus crassostreae]